MNLIILYGVLSFSQVRVDPEPEYTVFDTVQAACDSASHTIFPSTIWRFKIKPTDQCDIEGEHRFKDCLDWISLPAYSIERMRCKPAPNFTLEKP